MLSVQTIVKFNQSMGNGLLSDIAFEDSTMLTCHNIMKITSDT